MLAHMHFAAFPALRRANFASAHGMVDENDAGVKIYILPHKCQQLSKPEIRSSCG